MDDVVTRRDPHRYRTGTGTAPASAPLGTRRRMSTWGLAVLVLAECVASAHAATLWYHRGQFNDYFRGRFGGKTAAGNGGGGAYDHLFGDAEKPPLASVAGECADGSSASCPAAAVAKARQSSVPRHSRLSKRLPSRPADCCSVACRECLPSEVAAERCGAAYGAARSAVLATRGGHLHGGGGVGLQGAGETLAAAAAASAGAAATSSSMATPFGLHLNLWKILFQVVLTTINVVCWLVPLRSKKISENKVALSLANAFSGGVFLSLAFGHLIPESVHGFQASLGGDMNEALPYMVILGGYLLIFFVEKVAFDAHEIMHEMQEGGAGPGGGVGDHHHGDEKEAKGNGTPLPSESSNVTTGGGRGAVILLGALAVHSILEMTALGLADTFGDSALLSLSIALHQPAESIALLVAFLKSGMPKPQIARYLSVFSCMGPIGVAIGMVVNNFASPLVDASMLAVVAGTFVYVGATEVIPEEWEDSERKWSKFAALISGIVTIFAITQYTMTLEASL